MASEVLERLFSAGICINEALRDDELRAILGKLETDKDKEVFGLVCKRWLHLQSTERKKLCARAGPHMLGKMAARFTRLHELDLSQSIGRSFYPGVTDSDLSVIASALASLRILNLHNCKGITDTGMVAIGSGLSYLQSLDVSYCRKLSDDGFVAVSEGCDDLRSLQLAGCRFVTDALLISLSKNCHNLEDLGLQGCISITESGLSALVEGCRKIKHLDIDKCNNVGDTGILSVTKTCSTLTTLKLLDCYKVGDEAILSIARYCKNLETLIIGGCRNITDKSLNSLATALGHNLKILRMDWCLNVTDSSMSCIFSNCRNLEVLDIGCCEEVSDAAFHGLADEQSLLRLKVLKVSNCPNITVSGIAILVEHSKFLQYLDVRSCLHITKARCDEAGLVFPKLCKVNFTGSLAEPDVLI